eukprot:6360056-Amphidinium_carterae.1
MRSAVVHIYDLSENIRSLNGALDVLGYGAFHVGVECFGKVPWNRSLQVMDARETIGIVRLSKYVFAFGRHPVSQHVTLFRLLSHMICDAKGLAAMLQQIWHLCGAFCEEKYSPIKNITFR